MVLMQDIKDTGKLGIFVSLLLYTLVTIQGQSVFTSGGAAYNALSDVISAINTVPQFLTVIIVMAVVVVVLKQTDRI